MKNKKLNEELDDPYLNEVMSFLSLCGKEDRGFLRIPKNKRKKEEYVRLICIAKILGFDRIALMLIKKSEERIDEICDYVVAIRHDLPTVLKWMDDFIAKIPIPEFKQLVMELWQDKLQRVEKDNFSVKNLFI